MKIYAKIFLFSSLFLMSACSISSNQKQITSFEDCVAAGYAILESYPEQCATEDGTLFVNTNQKINIKVTNPTPNATVSKDITIQGEASGTWFFEAVFPILIEDNNGQILANGYSEAKSDWMTEDLVPFTAEITLDGTYEGTAVIIIKKANPSGLPENEEEIRIPINIKLENTTDLNEEQRLEAETMIKANIVSLAILEPVLGGTFFVTEIEWQNRNEALVTYEDGHIQGKALAKIAMDANGEVFIASFEEIESSS